MDKKMKKSIFIRVIIVLALVGAYLLVSNLNKPVGDDTSKTVILEIFNLDEESTYNEAIKTNAETLGELIDEVNEQKLKFNLSGDKDSEFGRYIETIEDVENKSGFWVYESENNKMCLAEAFCPGIDALVIEDKDKFEFTITKP